jgi:hypothetical protein
VYCLVGQISLTQKKVLRWAANEIDGMTTVAGNKQAPYISAARALCRKGLLTEWRTSHYAITDLGKKVHYILSNTQITNTGQNA